MLRTRLWNSGNSQAYFDGGGSCIARNKLGQKRTTSPWGQKTQLSIKHCLKSTFKHCQATRLSQDDDVAIPTKPRAYSGHRVIVPGHRRDQQRLKNLGLERRSLAVQTVRRWPMRGLLFERSPRTGILVQESPLPATISVVPPSMLAVFTTPSG